MASWTRQLFAAGMLGAASVAMAQSFQDETYGQQDAGSSVQADAETQQQGQSDLQQPGQVESIPVAQGTPGMFPDGGFGGSGYDPGTSGAGMSPDAGVGGSGIDYGTGASGMGTDAGTGFDLGGTGSSLDLNAPGSRRP